MLTVCFSGTRQGLQSIQYQQLKARLLFLPISHAIHGDCVGADAEYHGLIRETCPGAEISTYLVKGSFCAGMKADHSHLRTGHLSRNKEMVRLSNLLISCPPTQEAQDRGGTWFTTRFADKINVPLIIILPNGEIKYSYKDCQ